MQTQLDRFFHIPKKEKKTIPFSYFIYDPDQYRATFEETNTDKDRYITTKVDIQLYYRPPSISRLHDRIIPRMDTEFTIPLLKSNLQKAVRRSESKSAIQSALAILQREPIEFLRRLPILFIEDVCLMDSFPIVIWLMMADKHYLLNTMDMDILLRIVRNLCETKTYYEPTNVGGTLDFDHHYLSTVKEKDCVLSLYYRMLYGGMKGDMSMLRNAIYYYNERPDEIGKTRYDLLVDYDELGYEVHILPESIDFHPFPYIIERIVRQTGFSEDDVRTCIWFAESGVNYRKEKTLELSSEYMKHPFWKRIQSCLNYFRRRMM